MADAPGRQKVSEGGGPNAVFNCQWCATEGQAYRTKTKKALRKTNGDDRHKTTLYPAGNVQPAPIKRYALWKQHVSPGESGNHTLCYAGENSSKFTPRQQQERMKAAEESGIATHGDRLKEYGINGFDIFTTNLCFGGEDMCDVWITASSTGKIYKTRWPRPGLKLAFTA